MTRLPRERFSPLADCGLQRNGQGPQCASAREKQFHVRNSLVGGAGRRHLSQSSSGAYGPSNPLPNIATDGAIGVTLTV